MKSEPENSAQHRLNQLELDLTTNIAKTAELLRDKKLKLALAESCTGGLLSSYFTQVSGVSEVYNGAVVSYANEVKENVLGVKRETLIQVGVVSEACAAEMASGALKTLNADVAIAITGIAGPSGGTELKPIGTVFIAVAGTVRDQNHERKKNQVEKFNFLESQNSEKLNPKPERNEIQKLSCLNAVKNLQKWIKEEIN